MIHADTTIRRSCNARTNNTDLSYDYIMVKGSCSNFEPAIIDTDGALRWVGTAGISVGSATFFDNAVYVGHGHQLSRIDLDGTVTVACRLQQSRNC